MSILHDILKAKRVEVDKQRRAVSLEELQRACVSAPPPRRFAESLRRSGSEPIRVIAEVKRASPSAGPIRPDAVPVEIAHDYARGGATAISCLTDEQFFDGRLAYLNEVRAAGLPVLRKDFVIDEYQIVEARAHGADAVLLIVAALSDGELECFIELATKVGLDALVEVHDAPEAERAVAAGAQLIGINHRNLKTFEVDTSLTAAIRPRLPDDTIVVGESGIRTAEDLLAMRQAGADAVLVGESLMRAPSPGAALASLLEERS